MTTEHTTDGLIGAPIRRVEDPALITGKGCDRADLQLPGMLNMAFLRTTHPHARIISVTTTAAKALPGVVAVVSGADVAQLQIPVPPMISGQKIPPHPVL